MEIIAFLKIAHFLRRKMSIFEKTPTKDSMSAIIQREGLALPPLALRAEPTESEKRHVDFVVTAEWRGKEYRFVAELKQLWTPKAVEQAVYQAVAAAEINQLLPMVIVPYLSEEQLLKLEGRGISGIDLCGNGVVTVPGELLVFRSGNPNRFRWEARIKNVFQGTSALVARLFLVVPEFPSVGAALESIRDLGGEVTLPTVSKVCARLEEELIIERSPGKTPSSRRLRLLQPDKLLDMLRANYTAPLATGRFRGQFAGSPATMIERFSDWQRQSSCKIIRSGADSVGAYAIMAREPVECFYCSDLARLKNDLGDLLTETDRFSTLQIIETNEPAVYFDPRKELTASPVQTYLELAAGDKREQETAEQVRRVILEHVQRCQSRRRATWKR